MLQWLDINSSGFLDQMDLQRSLPTSLFCDTHVPDFPEVMLQSYKCFITVAYRENKHLAFTHTARLFSAVDNALLLGCSVMVKLLRKSMVKKRPNKPRSGNCTNYQT